MVVVSNLVGAFPPGVPQFDVSRSDFTGNIVDLLAEKTAVFASKGEARRMLKSNAVSLNKEKVQDSYEVGEGDLLNNRYLLVQKGKKNYFLLKVD